MTAPSNFGLYPGQVRLRQGHPQAAGLRCVWPLWAFTTEYTPNLAGPGLLWNRIGFSVVPLWVSTPEGLTFHKSASTTRLDPVPELAFSTGQDFTCVLWLRPTAFNGGNPGVVQTLIDGFEWNFPGTTGRPFVSLGGVTVLNPGSGDTMALNEFHCIAISVKSGTGGYVNYYRNGHLQHSASHSASVSADTIQSFGFQFGTNENILGFYQEIRWYDRALSAAEMWQLFAPQSRYDLFEPIAPPVWYSLPAAPSVQTARPTSTVTVGAWTDQASGTTDMHSPLADETDTTYIQSELAPSSSFTEVQLGALSDPAVSTGHIIEYRYAKSPTDGDQIDLTVQLRQGASTVIASAIHTDISGSIVAGELTLSGAEADAITNYNDLRLRFIGTQV